jgi:hypothetical protein
MDVGIRDCNRINHRDAPGVRVFLVTTNSPSEKRLEELREQAWKEGAVAGQGVDVAGGPIPRKPGYYGQPVVKPPVWTWEVPLYFFFGGMAGMSAVIASGAIIFHHVDLARAAMWVACIGGTILSPVLLIMDLGRPHLFLNMLRVFKHRSAMSMGAWILSAFGACAVPGLIALELHTHQIFPGIFDQLLRRRRNLNFWFGDLRNSACDLHWRADRCDRNSSVVSASHPAADPFWNGRIRVRRWAAGIARTPNRCA